MDNTSIYEQYDQYVHASWSVPPTQEEYKMWVEQARGSRLADLLPKDRSSRILDLGCGVGHLLYILREHGFAGVQGVDVCPGAIARARQMSLCVHSADILSFLAATKDNFDCIVGIDIIEHLTRQHFDELLELIRLRLNSGGSIIFHTVNGDSPWCQSYFAGDPTHETLFTPRSLKSILGLHGFSEFAIHEVVPPRNPIKHRPRYFAWKVLRLVYAAWNFVETGTGISGVYSRNFLLRARLIRP